MPELTMEQRQTLLRVARQSIEQALRGETPRLPAGLDARLLQPGAVFVTLTQNGELRGCIGSLVAHRPLAEDVVHNALAAAFEDPRFPPLTAAELPYTRIEISLLTPYQPLSFQNADELVRKLRPSVDGVLLEVGWHRATFLPQVWEHFPNAEDFLAHLCLKAGLPANAWRWPQAKVYVYQVEKFTESGEAGQKAQ